MTTQQRLKEALDKALAENLRLRDENRKMNKQLKARTRQPA